MTYNETADDLNKKFHNTYVKYQGEVVFVSNFSESAPGSPGTEIACIMNYVGAVKGGVQKIVKPEEIEVIQYNSTFVNNIDFSKSTQGIVPAVLVHRNPKRQWKRGICQENTLTRCPISKLYDLYRKPFVNSAMGIGYELVQRLVSPTYPSFAEAIDLCKVYQAIAVSPLFAILLSPISKDRFLLASQFGFIGEAIRDYIWIRHPPALQEVRDWVQRSGQHDITVEVA